MFKSRNERREKSLIVPGVAREVVPARSEATVIVSLEEMERRRTRAAWQWWDREGRDKSKADLAAADMADAERGQLIDGLRRSLNGRQSAEKVQKVAGFRLNPMTPVRAAKEAVDVLVEEVGDPVEKMQLIANLVVEEKTERDRRERERSERRSQNEVDLVAWFDGGGSRRAFKEAVVRVQGMLRAGMTEEQMEQTVRLGTRKAPVFEFGEGGACERVEKEVGTVETFLLQSILDERNDRRRGGRSRAVLERAKEQTSKNAVGFSRALGGLVGERVIDSLTRLALAAGEEEGKKFDGSVRQLADGNARRGRQLEQRRAAVQTAVDNSLAMRILRRTEQTLSGVRDEVHSSIVGRQGSDK